MFYRRLCLFRLCSIIYNNFFFSFKVFCVNNSYIIFRYIQYRSNPLFILKLNVMDILKQADDLYNDDKMLALYELLNESKEELNHFLEDEYLWRLARCNYQAAKIMLRCKRNKISWDQIKNEYQLILQHSSIIYQFYEAKGIVRESCVTPKSVEHVIENLYKQGLEYARAAVAINAYSSLAHKWLGVMTNCNLAYESLQNQIAISFEIKDEFEKAIELNSNDPTLFYCLGCWHYEISKLSWYAKSLAKLLGPGKSFSSTFQDALNEFLQAEKLQPLFYCDNLFMIATCYKELGNKIEAKNFCDKILKEYPIRTTEDKEVVAKVKVLQKSL